MPYIVNLKGDPVANCQRIRSPSPTLRFRVITELGGRLAPRLGRLGHHPEVLLVHLVARGRGPDRQAITLTLHDRSPPPKANAARALGLLGERSALPALATSPQPVQVLLDFDKGKALR